MTVGERIHQRRTELGMKAEDLAEELGVSRATIYRYEGKGAENLPAEFIFPLAAALRTTPQWILCVEDQATSTKGRIKNLVDHLSEEEAAALLALLEARLKSK